MDRKSALRWIDMPPIWLALFIGLAWAQGHYLDFGLDFAPPWMNLPAGLLTGGGLLLIGLAAMEFRRARTTIIPHEDASRLITSGIYRYSRNPIYLGDVLVLFGLILFFDAVLSLTILPIFVCLLERRFILPEENRLRRRFRADFARWSVRTRRWI